MEPCSATASPDTLRWIRWSITTACRYSVLNCLCLTQALTAKAMLKRRRLRSTLYLGLSRREPEGLTAHAWLKVGTVTLVGESEESRFAVLTSFRER